MLIRSISLCPTLPQVLVSANSLEGKKGSHLSGFIFSQGRSLFLPTFFYFKIQVDTSAANGSSEGLMWLRLVQSARDREEQNLEAYIKNGQLFYRSLRRIAKDEELLVWYGKELTELLLLCPSRPHNKLNGRLARELRVGPSRAGERCRERRQGHPWVPFLRESPRKLPGCSPKRSWDGQGRTSRGALGLLYYTPPIWKES